MSHEDEALKHVAEAQAWLESQGYWMTFERHILLAIVHALLALGRSDG